jgi:hypothetical protein
LAEARDRACFLAMVRGPRAFFAVTRDPDRFFAVVRAPPVFFAVVRCAGRFFVARIGDFEAERFPPLELPLLRRAAPWPAGWEREDPRGADRPEVVRPDGVPFEPANRISRTSSRPAATDASIMLARSICLTAMRALPKA